MSLYNYQRGFASESLAAFLLNKFSHVAHPLNNSNDVGIDFFCTFFEPMKLDNIWRIYPKFSFSVQVKSEKDSILVKDSHYLNTLEVPYFLGVLDKDSLSLTLFSGEVLPQFFSKVGNDYQGKIHLVPEMDGTDIELLSLIHEVPGGYELLFPKIISIDARFNYFEDVKNEVRTLESFVSRCRLMQRNIATRTNHEYTFESATGEKSILVGSESKVHFLRNLKARLWEAKCNLAYFRHDESLVKYKEFIERMYQEFMSLYEPYFIPRGKS